MLSQVAVEALYSATYVENYLDSVENLPEDIQRHLTRLHEIDVQYLAHLRDIDYYHEQWENYSTNDLESAVTSLKRARALTRIHQSMIAAQELGDEKIAIVSQVQDLIDHKSKQLKDDFENLDYGNQQTSVDHNHQQQLQQHQQNNHNHPSHQSNIQQQQQQSHPQQMLVHQQQVQPLQQYHVQQLQSKESIPTISSISLSTPILSSNSIMCGNREIANGTGNILNVSMASSNVISLNATVERLPSSSVATVLNNNNNSSNNINIINNNSNSNNNNSNNNNVNNISNINISNVINNNNNNSNERTAKRARRTRNEVNNNMDTSNTDTNVNIDQQQQMLQQQQQLHQQQQQLQQQQQGHQKQSTATAQSSTNSANQKKATNTTKKTKKRKSVRNVIPAPIRNEITPPEEPIDPDEPTYCLCDQISFGEMILCDNDLCPIEWFHFSCVLLVSKPKGKWFCPNCRGDRPNVMKPKAQFLKELERYNKEKEEKI